MQARLERLEAEVSFLRREVQELRALLGVASNDSYELLQPDSLPASGPFSPAARAVHSVPDRASASIATPSRATSSVPPTTLGETDPLPGLATPTAEGRPLPRSERDRACVQIGRFISNSLAGRHRGASGRDLLPQGSKYWLVCRTVQALLQNWE